MYQSNARISQDSDFSEESSEEEDIADDEKAHTMWQHSRYDVAESPTKGGDPHADDVLQHEFLRKYLHFAKTRMKPVLTEEARECIAGRYAEMRSRQDERTLPVTARSLETIIRLASAHAKVST
jgi:DNA replication licensing factor MCM3